MTGIGEPVAVATGAGSGVGKATALRLARDGVRLVANDLRPAAAQFPRCDAVS
jgi:NAD(P)-dependent dehydrogenase (short-subunit alcohol dehydrogenase family)